MFTRFYDMCSGGKEKLKWSVIYIEAPREEAIDIFSTKFNRDPDNVTCHCCGPDYYISERDSVDVGDEDLCLVIKKDEICCALL